jgi:UDP-glucose 4-epimerase
MASRVCIIGGTGFLGSYVVDLLHERGAELTVVGRNVTPTRQLPSGVAYRSGDYGDADFLHRALRGADQVLCLAHTTIPKTSFDDPVGDIFGNLPAAVKLYQAVINLGIAKVVFVSSGGTVYGPTHDAAVDEQAPTRPISPYGITKLSMEKYAFMYHAVEGLPIVCVRPANAYGPRQTPFSGQGFVATAMASLRTQRSICIFGEPGTVRDYVHARDVASGIVAALDRGSVGSCYNIGSGQGRSTRAVLDEILSIARADGYHVDVQVLPERRFDVPTNVLDSKKLADETGWSSQVRFEVGIRETWRWYRDHWLGGNPG